MPKLSKIFLGIFLKIILLAGLVGDSTAFQPTIFARSSAFSKGAFQYPYTFDYGVRFYGNQTSYFQYSKSAGNRNTWTFSTWIQRSRTEHFIGTGEAIWCGFQNTSNFTSIGIDGAAGREDSLQIYSKVGNVENVNINTHARLTDIGAWYHIVVEMDANNATPADRVRMWVNGVEDSLNRTILHPGTGSTWLGSASSAGVTHYLAQRDPTYTNPFMGLMAQTVIEYGYLASSEEGPQRYGQFVNGIWVPRDLSHLNGSNTDNVLLEYANFDNPEINTYPSTIQTITRVGTEIKGSNSVPHDNFPIINQAGDTANSVIYNYGQAIQNTAATAWQGSPLTMSFPKYGKWYLEVRAVYDTASHLDNMVSVMDGQARYNTGYPCHWYTDGYCYQSNGTIYTKAQEGAAVIEGDTYTTWGTDTTGGPGGTNNVVGVLLDMDNKTLTFKTNNTTTEKTFDISSWKNEPMVYLSAYGVDSRTYVWTGVGGSNYSPPAGYEFLSTAKLRDPDIMDPEEGLWMPLWTGDGTTSRKISGAKFNVANKSLVWIKNRDFGTHHVLTDTARGAGNWIESSSPNKQNYALSIVSNFKSDGFVIGNSAAVNTNLEKYVAWVYNMIPRFGMQTLRWTGTGVNRLVPHDLGVAPELVITKDLTEDNRNWLVGSDALTSWAYVLDLNLNIFESSTSLPYNGLAPTASDINIGTSLGTNKLNNEYVAYIFRSVPGFSKTGVFYGTGGTDENAFVQTDFPVAYLMVKSIDTNGSWVVLDRGRKKYNPIGNYLAPDLTNVEGANQWFDFYHNGFKGRIGLISGNRYFYLAFADHPFKYATAR